jgi:hypothetical protein
MINIFVIDENKLIFLLSILLSICIIICMGEIVSASSKISIHPQTVLFLIKEEPSDDIPVYPAYNSVDVSRKNYTGDVYYVAGELIKVNNPGQGDYAIPPEYLLVDTPYTTEYQPMDTEILFLAAGDSNSSISFKLLQDVWFLVPAGVYIGHLTGTNVSGLPTVNIVVMKWGGASTSFLVSPESIMVYADNGPDLYPAEESINVDINSIDDDWVLNISAAPLDYIGDEDIQIDTEDIYMALNDPQAPYHSMDNDHTIYGNNYGSSANLEFFVKVQTRWEHRAGDYTGDICFTLSDLGDGGCDKYKYEYEDEYEDYIEDDDDDD